MSNENPQVVDNIAERAVVCGFCGHWADHHQNGGGVCDQDDGCLGFIARPQVVDKRRFTDEGEIKVFGADDMPPNPSPQSIGQGFSPSSQPSSSPGMDFPTALKQVIKGNRVTRLEWENPEIWLMMFYWGAINPKVQAGKYLSVHHADGAVHPLYVGDGDLLADDWVIVV